MKKFSVLMGVIMIFCAISCGPSAESMAKKSCNIYKKFLDAQTTRDTVSMKKYDEEFQKLDKELTGKYQYENPEWLLKYARLREQCMKETK